MPNLHLPPGEQRALMKEVLKEGLKEWLDSQFAQFGRWSAAGIAALIIGGLAYFAFKQGIR